MINQDPNLVIRNKNGELLDQTMIQEILNFRKNKINDNDQFMSLETALVKIKSKSFVNRESTGDKMMEERKKYINKVMDIND